MHYKSYLQFQSHCEAEIKRDVRRSLPNDDIRRMMDESKYAHSCTYKWRMAKPYLQAGVSVQRTNRVLDVQPSAGVRSGAQLYRRAAALLIP
jgi:hypothetical protein